MPVQGPYGPVVTDGGSGVGVGGGLLYVSERKPGVEGGGNERVAQRVGADLLADPGLAGQPFDGAGRGVSIQPGACLPVQGDRAFSAFPDTRARALSGGGARLAVTTFQNLLVVLNEVLEFPSLILNLLTTIKGPAMVSPFSRWTGRSRSRTYPRPVGLCPPRVRHVSPLDAFVLVKPMEAHYSRTHRDGHPGTGELTHLIEYGFSG